MEARQRDLATSIGLLILRLGVGGYLLTHGWGKVQMLFKGQFEQFTDPFGVSNALALVLATGAEFLCSLLVILGLGTRFAAVPVVITMAVAAFMVHGGDPWTAGAAYELFTKGESKFPVSREPALLFLVPFLALVFTGAGRFSIDAMIRARRHGRSDAAHAAASGHNAG